MATYYKVSGEYKNFSFIMSDDKVILCAVKIKHPETLPQPHLRCRCSCIISMQQNQKKICRPTQRDKTLILVGLALRNVYKNTLLFYPFLDGYRGKVLVFIFSPTSALCSAYFFPQQNICEGGWLERNSSSKLE